MLSAFTLAGSLLLVASQAGATEEPPRFDVGKAVSTTFLLDLTDPRRSGYRIGVVNTQLASGMLLPIQGSEFPIEFIAGGDNWLWAQAAAQARSKRPSDPLRLAIDRRSIVQSSCPTFAVAAQRFFTELEATLARPIKLLEPPPAKHRLTDAEGNEQIVLDGTSFLIQVALADATVIVVPDGWSEPALQQATYELHSVVSGCSNSAAPSIEFHDF
jgi:hypothetical protein